MTRMNAVGGPAPGLPVGFPRRIATRRGAVALAFLAAAGLVGAALPLLAPVARAAGASVQFTTSHFELPVAVPGGTSVIVPQGTGAQNGAVPLYERAPVPNQDALAPEYDSGSSDPVQPSVIRRASQVGESDGYSRSSSSTSAQESRMKPGLGFALHVPTD